MFKSEISSAQNNEWNKHVIFKFRLKGFSPSNSPTSMFKKINICYKTME